MISAHFQGRTVNPKFVVFPVGFMVISLFRNDLRFHVSYLNDPTVCGGLPMERFEAPARRCDGLRVIRWPVDGPTVGARRC